MTEFVRLLKDSLTNTRLFPGEDLLFQVFLNPAAGLLVDKRRLAALLGVLKESVRPASEQVFGEGARTVSVEIHRTDSRRESLERMERATEKLETFVGEGEKSRRAILLTAGGDGFHKDCVSHLLRVNPGCFKKILLFRLPLGTGNDTPLVTDGLEAFALFSGEVAVVKDSYIQSETARGVKDYALNVASFGLDAFVCLLLEKFKGKLRGDIYKIMVDVSALFYDFYHRTKVSRLTLYPSGNDSAQEILTMEKRVLINVFGRRGETTYGGGKKILPGPENHLVTGMFRLPGRVMLKGLFMKGGHWPGRERVSFHKTDKMVLEYPEALLMELDGEVVFLEKEDFPVTLTRIDGEISVLN